MQIKQYEKIKIGDCAYPDRLIEVMGGKAPKIISFYGDLNLLSKSSVGVLSSRKVEPACILASYEVLDILSKMELVLISGWASPLEEELLGRIKDSIAPVGIFLAKGIEYYDAEVEIIKKIEDSNGFIFSHCSPKVSRITRQASLRRNKIVSALANILFIPAAEPNSSTLKIGTEAICRGKSVFTVDNQQNKELIASGAQIFEKELFQETTTVGRK